MHRCDDDPTLGRYLQADPLGLAAGQSLYGYVGGDPVNFVDPFGLDGVAIAFRDQKINGPWGTSTTSVGHAGVVIINDATGYTEYHEFGRYNGNDDGECQRRTIPNLLLDSDGKPTAESISRLLQAIQAIGGSAGSSEILLNWNFAANDFNGMQSEVGQCAERKNYSALVNNRGHFATDVVEAGGGGFPLHIQGRSSVPNVRVPSMLGPEFLIKSETNLDQLSARIRAAYDRRD